MGFCGLNRSSMPTPSSTQRGSEVYVSVLPKHSYCHSGSCAPTSVLGSIAAKQPLNRRVVSRVTMVQ